MNIKLKPLSRGFLTTRGSENAKSTPRNQMLSWLLSQEEIDLINIVNSLIIRIYYLDIWSLSDHVEVDRVEVNRGNCPIQYSSSENPLGYGQSVRYILNCDPHNVREVKVYLQDGRELLMSPK